MVDPDPDLSALPRIASARGASDVLRTARSRQYRRKLMAGAGVLAAGALMALMVGGQAPTLRARGAGGEAPLLVVRAVLDDPAHPARLSPGDVVAPGAGVVVQVVTSAPGTLEVWQGDSERIWPVRGRWQVEAGTHLVGGEAPVAWIPEGVGPVELVARLCPEGADCVQARLPLVVR